ncbi:MAG: energy-coupling factor transporter transmembrane protein EcfT [Candidatus Methanomethyliaceae archaeon]|nr:energy-coupling factor transporter transmembrane protein EcfT [Candidatus Methanomethyliaceae archaeon]
MSSTIKDLVQGLEEILEVETPGSLKKDISPLALIVIASLIIASALIATSFIQLLVMGGLNLLLGISLRIRPKRYLIKPAIFALLMLLISLPAAFLTEGAPLFAINLGPFTIAPSSEGTYRVLQFVLRVWVCIGALILPTSILGIDGILNILYQTRAPKIVLQTISLTYRYLFVSIHEAQKMLLAREARRYKNKKFINSQDLRDLGKILAALFIRTYERSERVYLAMKARGFTIERSRSFNKSPLKLSDLPFVFAVLIVIFLALTNVA